jgi:periplasmic protein TonB
MFGDTLLESSSTGRKGKKWPMATAFTVEAIVGAIVVIVPLLSTGVIPTFARTPIYTPQPLTVETVEPIRTDATHRSGPASSAPRSDEVILVSNNPDAIHWGENKRTTTDPAEAKPPGYGDSSSTLPTNLIGDGSKTDVRPSPTRIVSVLTEAQLVNRVEPVYPHIAAVTGIQGQVKLHAIIARDGSVQSLNAISGHPLLVRAALDAVGQWRYRPYYLNGVAVEVETFITVNFRKEVH